jgi:hypothetical protein
MSKQTATDYLIQEIKNDTFIHSKSTKEWNEVFKKAKQMEREQVISNYCSGFEASGQGWNGEYGLKDMFNVAEEIEAEKYYQETYGETKN